MDPSVKILNIRSLPGFDIHTLTPLKSKVVTFMVGSHGPFNLTYNEADYNDFRVSQDIQKEVDTLRGIGALS
jgi:hypothetical protein